ncbi:MAG: hypothetical protein ACHQNA_02730 [Acidimicrobiales bacterium]
MLRRRLTGEELDAVAAVAEKILAVLDAEDDSGEARRWRSTGSLPWMV